MTGIALELDRLCQEVSATQHVLDDAEPNSREEVVHRLRHIATRANQIAAIWRTQAWCDGGFLALPSRQGARARPACAEPNSELHPIGAATSGKKPWL
jgi:hypothetical protein